MPLDPTILEAGAPTEADISLTRGDTPRIRGDVWNDTTRTKIPITGAVPTLEITDADGTTVLLTIIGTVEAAPDDHQYFFDLSAAQTIALPFLPDVSDPAQQRAISARFRVILTAGTQVRTIAAGRILVCSGLD